MTFDSLRPIASRFIEPVAISISNAGVSPNVISVASLLFAAAAGVCFYYSLGSPVLVLVAALFVVLNSFMDALDGSMARYLRVEGPKGDFLDHVIDRYADVFIISGIFFGGYVQWEIGVIAIVGVLLTSYLGTQAQALGVGRYYGGIMGRADRLVLIILASLVYFFYPSVIVGFSVLGWAMVVIAFGSHITAFQRIINVWNRL